MYRVLKPGGKMMCLEFSKPTFPVFRWLYDFYSFNVMPFLGGLLAGSRGAYTHLPESIRMFPMPDELSDMLKTILEPYIGTYKSIKHPCAAAAVSSKVIEKYDQFKKTHQREPIDKELNLINICISHELNLNRNSADVLV